MQIRVKKGSSSMCPPFKHFLWSQRIIMPKEMFVSRFAGFDGLGHPLVGLREGWGGSIVKDLAPHKPTSKPGELGEGWKRIVEDLTPHKPTSKPGGGGRMGKDIKGSGSSWTYKQARGWGKDSKGTWLLINLQASQVSGGRMGKDSEGSDSS